MLARHAWAALGLAGLLALGACGSPGEDGAGGSPEEARAEPRGESGGLPVAANEGPVDEALAEEGAATFQARGCIACHTVGNGRLVGPDLAGVTARRSFEWFYHMVTNPDSMVQNDSIARRLLAEYLTPMMNQGATPEDVRALWEHLRRAAESGVEPQARSRRGPTTPSAD
ncbi:MAG: c-type cytochrome [Gemmatimonadota bacterium]